jgi:hypothetical protein
MLKTTNGQALSAALLAQSDLQAAQQLPEGPHAQAHRAAAAHASLATALLSVDRPGALWRIAGAAVRLAWHAGRLR